MKQKSKGHFRVAIFGSARIKKGDPTYDQIKSLARLIAENGWDVVTGGGPGLMAAASAGHKLGKKVDDIHTIGLHIKLPQEQRKSKNLDIVKNFNRFSNRLDSFVSLANAVVVAPGGIGTLLEFFYTWQLIQVKHTCKIPIILLGDQYKDLNTWLKNHILRRGYMDKSDFRVIFPVKNNTEALKVIKNAFVEFKKGHKKICYNLT